MKKVIELKNVCKKYYKDKQDIIILDNLSFSFFNNKFYAIVGKSGVGKTTLLKCISLLNDIDFGRVIINGKNIKELSDDSLSKVRSEDFGIIFQDYNLLEYLTSIENVMLPLYLRRDLDKTKRIIKAETMLDYVDLKQRKNHYPKELSGGEKQRVAIARALINEPSIILADEPTGNLDFFSKKKVLEILKKISHNGKCVIVVTHDPDVLEYADEIYTLIDGKMVKYEI